MRVLVVLAAVLLLAVGLGWAADVPKREIVNGRQVAYRGLGAEAWAARYRQERQRADWNRRKRLELRQQVRSLERKLASLGDPISAIRFVFGPYADQAIRVSSCETGGTFSVYARNGQYLGLFQMGEYARGRYGHSWTALGQARAAYRYFVDSGRTWGPWECKP